MIKEHWIQTIKHKFESNQQLKNCVKFAHIINKPNLHFMRKEEILTTEKKYKSILDFYLSNLNAPKFPNKILNYKT